MKIGERLYNLRTKQGVYQKELAAYLNLSVSAISSYENDAHSPDLKTVGKMAEFFHVSVDYLLGRTEYIAPIGDMDRELLDQYTISDIKDTILELPSGRRQDIIKYLDLLKLSDDLENPSQQ
ncbi:MAG: helix-turn-helix transcriptional regulator [Lachnospiraceae bacterium]|nr:helix-turn-helix transcriptional regulator [Lachnospiraceae bacterium]